MVQFRYRGLALHLFIRRVESLPAGRTDCRPAFWNRQNGTRHTRTGYLASDLCIGTVTLSKPLGRFTPRPGALLGLLPAASAVTFGLARQRVRRVRMGTEPLVMPETDALDTPAK